MPETALKLSRGCGNPTGFAEIQPGEVVVDFGCGGGIDVILAARLVGQQGKVVGLDFAPKMIDQAKLAVKEAGLQEQGIELRVAELGNTLLPDSITDVIISNCVINLCSDKAAVYKEALRILKSGGRLAISDILMTEAIAPELRERFQDTWSGCLGGAMAEEEYWQIVKNAGFPESRIVNRHILSPKELVAMASCPGGGSTPPPASEDLAIVQGKVVSVKFTAFKPA